MNIKVTDKAVTVNGHEMWVKLIELDGVEGWTSAQVQQYFGMNQTAVSNAAYRANVKGTTLRGDPIKHLKLVGALRDSQNLINFYSKEQVREIALVVKTERAKEMIRHAFDVTEAVYKGDIHTAQTLAGTII